MEASSNNDEEEAVILYTRGTSGPAKGVRLSHKNLVAALLQAAAWIGEAEKGKEAFLSILPSHQAFGMTLAMTLPIYLAGMSIHLPQFQMGQVLSAVRKHRPTFFPASPSMIESLSTYPEIMKYKISSIKTCWSVGKALGEDDLQNFERKVGRKVSEAYGLTEASGLTHTNPLYGKRKAGSVGLPLPDTEAKIVDLESGEKEMPPGETGELIVKGPQVMKGYWNKPEETQRTLRGGWLHTGDLARMDEEGFFYITGRLGKDRK
jgi:long-chain acyl-CoA synthetase